MYESKGELVPFTTKELITVHETGTIAGMDYSKLTPAQKGRVIHSMLFFKEKYKPDGMFDTSSGRWK